VKLRLQPCLRWLGQALDSCAPPAGELTFAAATPKGALVFAMRSWPAVDDGMPCNGAAVALRVHAAIEGGIRTDIILRGAGLLLGRLGIAAASSDIATIALSGRCPLVVLLVERTGSAVTVVCTVTAMDGRTLH
jgi:hypothetical protein